MTSDQQQAVGLTRRALRTAERAAPAARPSGATAWAGGRLSVDEEGSGRGSGVPSSVLGWTLRRFWWVLLIGAVLGAGLATLVLDRSPATYASTARVMVGPLNGSTDSLRASGAVGETYADALSSPVTLRSAARSAGITGASDARLSQAVTVGANDKSRIITVQADWSDPERARALTSAMVTRLTDLAGRSPQEGRIPGAEPDVLQEQQVRRVAGVLTVIQRPTAPEQPLPGSRAAVVGLSGVAGAMLAFTGVTLLTGARARRLAAARGELPPGALLGSVTASRRHRARSGSSAADYADVARRLALRAPRGGWQRLLVTAEPAAGDHGDVAVRDLAAALARTGQTVELIDPEGRATDGRRVRMIAGQEEGRPDPETARQGHRAVLRYVRAHRSAELTAALAESDGVVLLASPDGEPAQELATLQDAAAEQGDAVVAGVVLVRAGGLAGWFTPDLRGRP